MSGSGAKLRKQTDAIRAAKLARHGWTHRAIAEALGKQPDQIKQLILRGERLEQIQEETKP